jgi:putative ABC transport system permease protein
LGEELPMIFESFRIALGAIWINKLRSLLTTLGIVIGVAATVAVVSLVQGFFAVIERQFEGLGTNTMHISPYRPPGTAGQKLGRIYLTWQDGQALRESIETIDEIVPELFELAVAKHGEELARTTLVGTTARFQEVRGFYVGSGRFFSQVDDRSRARVCAVGVKVVESLKYEGDPVGQTITLQGEEFRIVGVMEKQGELLGESFDDFVLIPYSTAASIYGPESSEQIELTLTTTSPDLVEQTRDRIVDLLRRRHGLDSDQPDDFDITSQEQLMSVLGRIIGGFTAVLGGIVSISLVVGGIGIMNIMLVSVTERMREIGLRKAIGAPKNLILLQFMIESVTISLVGGVIGILLGCMVGYGLAAVIPDWPGAFIPVWALALSFGFASLIGAVFGIYPAYRAACLDPIESLRYE